MKSSSSFSALTIIATLFFVGLLHVGATFFKIYDYVPYFDKLVHFIAGLAVGLCYLFFSKHRKNFITLVIVILLISVLWEWFEVFFGVALQVRGYWSDTLTDILANTLGAMIAYFLYKTKTEHEINA